MLSVERIGKSFGGVRALQDVSFAVPERSIFGIMGANGAGKTTLFAIIAGNLAPSAGAVRLRDLRLTGLPPHRVAAAGVARTFQIVRPFRGLSVQENVETALRFGARDRPAAAPADAAAILGLTGLDGVGRPCRGRPDAGAAEAAGGGARAGDRPATSDAGRGDGRAHARRSAGHDRHGAPHPGRHGRYRDDHRACHGRPDGAVGPRRRAGPRRTDRLGPPAQVADDPAVRSAYLGRRH